MVKQVLSIRKYKAGYEVRHQLMDGEQYGGTDYEMKTAYTPDGKQIGDSKTAYRLCKKRGIKPELSHPNNSTCSIGFSEKEQKWYGWSHRAIYGFGIGSTCEKGDCHYTPDSFAEIQKDCHCKNKEGKCQANAGSEWDNPLTMQDAITFHGEEYSKGKKLEDMALIPVPGTEVLPVECCLANCVFELGRGEWITKTLDDAKQMAIDFASGVS